MVDTAPRSGACFVLVASQAGRTDFVR